MGVKTCPYCGKKFNGTPAVNNHAKACLHVPENEARLRTVPVGIQMVQYQQQNTANKWPSRTFITQQFGNWRTFQAWLASDQPFSDFCPALPIEDEDAIRDAEIDQETHTAQEALRTRQTGLPVFDQPRRIWEAGGRTWVSWGIR